MGVYLLMIAIYDAHFAGEYNKHSLAWKRSIGCQFIGSLSVLSALVSPSITPLFILLHHVMLNIFEKIISQTKSMN